MKLSDLTKLIIGVAFTIGFIVLTAKRIIPPEAFCVVASASIIFIVEEWRKEREIARITKLLGKNDAK